MTILSFPRKRESSPGKPGFRIKSGMTDTVKLLLRHYTSGSKPRNLPGFDRCAVLSLFYYYGRDQAER
jgi:hypothetical protein